MGNTLRTCAYICWFETDHLTNTGLHMLTDVKKREAVFGIVLRLTHLVKSLHAYYLNGFRSLCIDLSNVSSLSPVSFIKKKRHCTSFSGTRPRPTKGHQLGKFTSNRTIRIRYLHVRSPRSYSPAD